MSKSTIVRPLELKDKDRFKPLMVLTLFLLVLSVASYPLFFSSKPTITSRPALYYYCIICGTFSFLGSCYCYCSYWIKPNRNSLIFRIDENGVYFHYSHEKRAHSFKWSELKQITAQWCYNEKGAKERGVSIVTQEDDVYEFCVFKFFTFGWLETSRLKKAVNYFSKGSVPFKTAKLSVFYMNK